MKLTYVYYDWGWVHTTAVLVLKHTAQRVCYSFFPEPLGNAAGPLLVWKLRCLCFTVDGQKWRPTETFSFLIGSCQSRLDDHQRMLNIARAARPKDTLRSSSCFNNEHCCKMQLDISLLKCTPRQTLADGAQPSTDMSQSDKTLSMSSPWKINE